MKSNQGWLLFNYFLEEVPMTIKNAKTKMGSKAVANHKTKSKSTRRKKKSKKIENRLGLNSKLLMVITFFTGVLLIISTYAWLSQSLNVKVKFFDLSVSTDNGLFISLDGVDYSDSVEISMNSVITDLKATYPNHTNQWATGGLWSVSSNGIKNSNRDKLDVYVGEVSRYKDKIKKRRFLNTKLIEESEPMSLNSYIAFDLFLKNVSGSPKSDNLYLEDTAIDFDEETPEDVRESMGNIMNSMRFGFIKIGSVSSKADTNTVQNIKCNNACEEIIYEPNSTTHSSDSIENVGANGIVLIDGKYNPTYAVISEGNYLEHLNGQEGSGIPLDTDHFALQHTITNFDKPIFQIPNGVMKLRVYVWIEGQDIDSLETYSKGAAINISINFVKDLAGYE
jgi:hypothetical protein